MFLVRPEQIRLIFAYTAPANGHVARLGEEWKVRKERLKIGVNRKDVCFYGIR
jgi:hypothetical protein